jgi:hypothetical protein
MNRAGSIRLGAAIAAGLALAFVVWVVTGGDDGGDGTAAVDTAATTGGLERDILLAATEKNLRELARVTERPIYWAGSRSGTTYELTQARAGRTYVRYLPRGVAVGDRTGGYLLVATYPLPNAYRAVQRAGARPGAVTFRVPGGGLAVYNRNAATNVYFAYPRSRYQVEVYDPDPRTARRLVASGAIRPIR